MNLTFSLQKNPHWFISYLEAFASIHFCSQRRNGRRSGCHHVHVPLTSCGYMTSETSGLSSTFQLKLPSYELAIVQLLPQRIGHGTQADGGSRPVPSQSRARPNWICLMMIICLDYAWLHNTMPSDFCRVFLPLSRVNGPVHKEFCLAPHPHYQLQL